MFRFRREYLQGFTNTPTPRGGSQAHLLPQRVERFDDFLVRFSSASGLETSSVQRLTPPWTYQLLAISSGLMLAIELLAGLRWITQL